MAESTKSITRVGDGMYRVQVDDRSEIVYVAGPVEDRWVFWNGQIFRGRFDRITSTVPSARRDVAQSLTAPMPATVRKILVKPGDTVKRGDTLIVLEAMKMELPLRAAGDATITGVHCREGDLVQPDVVLVQMKG